MDNNPKQVISADQTIRLIGWRGYLETFTLKDLTDEDLTDEDTLSDDFPVPFDTWEEARDWVFNAVATGYWKPIGTFFFKSIVNGKEEFQKRDKLLNEIYIDS